MYEPTVTIPQAIGRYGGACRLGTPESQAKARAVVTAARLDKAVCDALNAGDLPDEDRTRLGLLLLGAK
jgi:hypothetical protein